MPTIQTSLLEITYRDDGPRDAQVVLLLHGWPDDSSTWDAIIPILNHAGLRTIAPRARGFGETGFRSPDTPRTGNAATLVLDVIEMLDALGIESFSVAGHDWGASMAEMLAIGCPNRVDRIAMLSTPPRLGGLSTPPFWHARLGQSTGDEREGRRKIHRPVRADRPAWGRPFPTREAPAEVAERLVKHFRSAP
jgi:pimeloyl-ACP methyl ester carboxylesterase